MIYVLPGQGTASEELSWRLRSPMAMESPLGVYTIEEVVEVVSLGQ